MTPIVAQGWIGLLLSALLAVACAGAAQPSTVADEPSTSKVDREQDALAGSVVIVAVPERDATEPLVEPPTEMSETVPVDLPRAPESAWCPHCPPACLDYVAQLERCLDGLPDTTRKFAEETVLTSKEALRSASGTQQARDALEPGCQAGLEALRNSPSCH